MLPVGFEPTIAAGERPQTHALHRVATGTGKRIITFKQAVPDEINWSKFTKWTKSIDSHTNNFTFTVTLVEECTHDSVPRAAQCIQNHH